MHKVLIKKENKKKAQDLILNIGAIVIISCVLQFLLYPTFNRELGAEKNGIMLALFSIVTVTAGSCGTSANYSRLINVNEREIKNGDYFVLLVISSVICSILGVICLWQFNLLTITGALCFILLMFLSSFRYYGDVEYKEKTNFVYYFFYYLCVSVGYVIGMFVFKGTENWIIAIAIGEIFGLIFCLFTSNLFRKPFKISVNFKLVTKSFSFLLVSTIIENLILHADRLILVAILGGEEVTYYYIASLFGKVVALLSVPINSIIISYIVKYKGKLNKKLWSMFTFGSLIIGAICFAGCMVFSILIIPVLYPNEYEIAKAYFVGAMLSQVMYFLSTILLVVILRFKGEKKQFICNLIFAIGFFGLSIPASILWDLNGFIYASLIVNVLRFIFVAVWGFIPSKEVLIFNQEKSLESENDIIGENKDN